MFDWHGLGDCHRCGKSQVGAWFRGRCKCEPLPPPVVCVSRRSYEAWQEEMKKST